MLQPRRRSLLLLGRDVNQLGMTNCQISFKCQEDVREDGAAEGDVVDGVEEVDEEGVVRGGQGEVERLDERELGDGGEEVDRVKGRHHDQNLVEDRRRHQGMRKNVDANLKL